MSQGSERKSGFWLGIGISALSLLALFYFISPADILPHLLQADLGFAALASAAVVAFMILRAVRWQFMLNSGREAAGSAPYRQVYHIQNVGYLLNNLLPFRLGDVARAVLIGNVPPITISQGLSTMVVERVLDMLFMVVLFPFTLAAVGSLPPEIRAAVRVAGFLAIAAIIVLLVAANQRSLAGRVAKAIFDRLPFLDTNAWVRRVDDLLLGLDVLTRLRQALVLLFLSIVLWLPIIVGYYWAMRAVGLMPSLVQATFVVCIAAFSVAAPSSPGQIGVFEAGVTFAIVTILGFPEVESASFAFLYHTLNYLLLGILGVWGIFSSGNTFSSVIASTRTLVRGKPKPTVE
jgi:glycosyltransferase 2 family protein